MHHIVSKHCKQFNTNMKCLVIVAALLQVSLSGHVSVRLPYLNPAGVTYVPGHTAYSAGGYTHGASVTNGLTTSTYYGNGHFLGRLAHAPLATAQVHGAVIPTVHQVPAVADVPVTRIEAQPGYIHKELDVAKPAVKTSRFELRRPAIQKQFYDIEERVIVRPAGSALVELEQPHSKIQKSSVVSHLAPTHLAPAHFAPSHFAPAHFAPAHLAPAHISHIPGVISASPAPPTFVSPAPPSFTPGPSPAPANDQGFDDDTVVIEARRAQQEYQSRAQVEQEQRQNVQQRTNLPVPSPQAPQPQTYAQSQPQTYAQPQPQTYAQSQPQPIPQPNTQPIAQPIARSRLEGRFAQDPSGNQQRLIELLTAREGVADVGFGGPTFRDIGDAGAVRARVLSAEYAPRDAPVTGERVKTRRVVVSRPIETIEEVDVLEPVTKYERVAVQHPAVFKTAHVGIARVPTSLPVYGKAVAPIVGKTVYSQAPIYYH